MQRRTLLIWVLIPLILILLILFFRESNDQILLGFNVDTRDNFSDLEFILAELAEREISATFFFLGNFVTENVEIVQLIAEAGHEIACQTMTGAYLSQLNDSGVSQELSCRGLIGNLTNISVRGFREPGNVVDERTIELLQGAGYFYDASTLEGLGWFYPKSDLITVPVTMNGPLPMDDSLLVRRFYLGDFAYFLMGHDRETTVSLELHPHLVAKHRVAFAYLLDTYLEDEARFVTHEFVANTQQTPE